MRHHFVFLRACGCPEGVTDYIPGCLTQSQAWKQMYGNNAEQRVAFERGITLRAVDHDTYSREYYPLMTTPCPHTSQEAG